ncbi:MAG: hypothetical protein FWD94_05180 [Treponema sp.]|nr:hypothetical protein [Treponema sp.]
MTFSERMKELLEQGVEASKEFAVKAGAKAQDLGERGVLMLEIKQLEARAKRLLGRLGTETYRVLGELGRESLDREEAGIKLLLDELAGIQAAVDGKEAELKARKTN